jgi:hypothetical protein
MALSFFECGFSMLLDALENMVMANLRCIPNIADAIYASLFPPEAIIATEVSLALWDLGQAVVNGIYSAASSVTWDFCWNDAPSVGFTDCGAFDFVESMSLWDAFDVVGAANRFADTVTRFTNCLSMTTNLPGVGNVPTPFLNVDWTGGSWCAPNVVQDAVKGVYGAFVYITGGRMLEDIITIGDRLLTKLQQRLEEVFCDEGDFTVTLGVDLEYMYAVLGIQARVGCDNGRFAAHVDGFVTGRISIFGTPYLPIPSAVAFFSIACDAAPDGSQWSYWSSSLNGIIAVGAFGAMVSLPLYPTPRLEFGYTFFLTLWSSPPPPPPPPRLEAGSASDAFTSVLPALRLISGAVSDSGFASELPDPKPIIEGARNGSLQRSDVSINKSIGARIAISVTKAVCFTCDDFGSTPAWVTGLVAMTRQLTCNVGQAISGASWGAVSLTQSSPV